jgi:spore coat protein U-like protein
MAFGSFTAGFGAAGAGLDASTTVHLTCASGVAWVLYHNQGQHSNDPNGDGIADLNMTNGIDNNLLHYSLYTDAAHTFEWKTGSGIVDTGTGADQQITVYGRIPYPQSPPPGSYTDSLDISLTF